MPSGDRSLSTSLSLLRRAGAIAALGLLLAACAGGPAIDRHPLEGRIWDRAAARFVDESALYERAAASRLLLLGEIHDNPLHHERQLQILRALDARGRRPALAMEQFDTDRQAALADAQRAGIRDPERLADAGALDRRGWGWPLYRDLIGFAAERRWPVIGANLSREAARSIALGRSRPQLPPASAQLTAALEGALVRGHCGLRPPQLQLDRMVSAQRARDARIAATLSSAAETAGQVVLIAGAGHVQRTQGVPAYLPAPLREGLLVVAMVETSPERTAPADYALQDYDLVWFTPAQLREDPCAKPLTGTAAPLPPGTTTGNPPGK